MVIDLNQVPIFKVGISCGSALRGATISKRFGSELSTAFDWNLMKKCYSSHFCLQEDGIKDKDYMVRYLDGFFMWNKSRNMVQEEMRFNGEVRYMVPWEFRDYLYCCDLVYHLKPVMGEDFLLGENKYGEVSVAKLWLKYRQPF